MPGLMPFLRELLEEGAVALRAPPVADPAESREARYWLAEIYADYRLDVAGPPLEFVAEHAQVAAEFLWQACWCLVRRDLETELIERHLKFPLKPQAPAQHLSVDLLFRFLPQLHRRSRALSKDDILTRRLEEVLSQWPLSGVLSDFTLAPAGDLEFGGHSGLQLLYAERFRRHQRPEWQPQGRTGEYLELVCLEYGEKAQGLPSLGFEQKN
jgi:hypothetical protein